MSEKKAKRFARIIRRGQNKIIKHFLSEVKCWRLRDRIKLAYVIVFKRDI